MRDQARRLGVVPWWIGEVKLPESELYTGGSELLLDDGQDALHQCVGRHGPAGGDRFASLNRQVMDFDKVIASSRCL